MANREHNTKRDAPSKIHTNGLFWAIIASSFIVVVPVTMTIVGVFSEKGLVDPRCSTTTNSGILHDVQSEISGHYDRWRTLQGDTRVFPPGRQCLLYGGKYFSGQSDGTKASYQLIAQRYYPSPSSYFWLIFFASLPFIVLFLVRRFRARQYRFKVGRH